MCGIAGIITKKAVEAHSLNQFWNSFAHRGPDDRGFLVYSNDEIKKERTNIHSNLSGTILFHQRLSILDLNNTGWQPMSSSDERYHIVFNGEIYNYLEIKEELQFLGHKFYSTSDTEVLLKAYIEWGEIALKKVAGMFAFAILDVNKQILFVARDHFGIKPLYYTLFNDGLSFASEMKTLVKLPFVNKQLDPETIYTYFRAAKTDIREQTFYSSIKQLKPAHFMVIPLKDPQNFQMECYWNLSLETNYDLSFQDAAKQLRELFLESIQFHMRSDVPISITLSGGIDSSAIASCIHYLYPDHKIHSFSYLADDNSFNEELWIDIVNSKTKAIPHKILPKKFLINNLDQLIYLQDQPFISTSIYAQYCVFNAIQMEGIKVTLDGQGADELLGGYRASLIARLATLIRLGDKDKINYFFDSCSKNLGISPSFWTRINDFLLTKPLQFALRNKNRDSFHPSWLNIAWFQERNVDLTHFLLDYSESKFVLKESLYDSLKANNLPQLLRYEDRNSMAFSIESRLPFLYPKLVQFIFSLPEEYIISNEGLTKAIFREAMKDIVPNEILNRRDKIGFQTPEKKWLMNNVDWIDKIFSAEMLRDIPFLNSEIIRKQWTDIKEGNLQFESRIWRWINFIVWYHQFKPKLH